MITVPTESQDPSTVRRMFALALASNNTKLGYYNNVNSGCAPVSLAREDVVSRAEVYLKFIEGAKE